MGSSNRDDAERRDDEEVEEVRAGEVELRGGLLRERGGEL